MIGQTISHYRITAKLGAGGMGEVYLATDTMLDRQVALKFLPEALRKDPEARERLLREAKAASKLDHPNIVTIHEVAEADGRDFIVMAYVEGRSLKDLIASGDLDICRIIETATQIGDGLAAAHKAGIVHRDIKSDNIIVTPEGRARIMDFGLATWHGATQLTREGSTVGTMAYMSPEQAQGQEVDQRTDLWSLGVILYEMVTRRLPFEGNHDAAITYSIINETPHPLARYSADVPEELQRIVGKCLAKDRAERYQSASDLVADLRALRRFSSAGGAPVTSPSRKRSRLIAAAAVIAVAVIAVGTAIFTDLFRPDEQTAIAERKMLAVLPFENLGAEDQEYFADGVTEEIIARLARLSDLGVIGRTSVLRYKGTEKSLQEIGKELGVDYILEGTIRWERTPDAPGRVRVTPQLINVADATHLWAEVYDEELTSVFRVQGDIATKVAEALNLTLLAPERHTLAERTTDNLAAYDYYLRGLEYMKEGSWESVRAEIRLFSRAVALDPDFAKAYTMLSRSYTELYWHQEPDNDTLLQAAQRALGKAMSIDPNLPEVHTARGSLYYHEGSYDRALEEFNIALADQPSNPFLLAEIAFTHRRRGRMSESIAALRKAIEFDPLSEILIGSLAQECQRARRFSDAKTYYDRVTAIAPDAIGWHVEKAWHHVGRNGDLESARTALANGAAIAEPDYTWKYCSAWLEAVEGNYESALEAVFSYSRSDSAAMYEAAGFVCGLMSDTVRERAYYDSLRVVEEERTALHPDNPGYHSFLGIAYAGLGRTADAIREGERAVRLGPLNEDYWTNPVYTRRLASICTLVGEDEKALNLLDALLSCPSWFSVAELRLNPRYARLHDHPRFQALLERGDIVF